MAQPLRFGLQVPSNVPWPTMVERCRSLEALGFDCLWMGDILLSPIERNLPWFGAWTALAGLATQTARIRLGTLITTFAVRHPVLLAKDALTVDHISNGRLEVGLGAGGYEDSREAKMLGRVIPDAPGRVRRFREGVELVDRLLRGETTTYRGRFFQVHEAVARPTPVQRPRPPLTIAAHGRVTLKIAAAYADSWNTFMGTRIGQTGAEVVEIIRTRNALLNEYAAARRRAPSDIIRSFLAGWTTDTPWASVDAFQDFVGRYAEAGINEFVFPYPPEEFARVMKMRPSAVQPGIFERVAREVIPGLRRTA